MVVEIEPSIVTPENRGIDGRERSNINFWLLLIYFNEVKFRNYDVCG